MGSRWRGKRDEACRLVVNNIYLWKMLFLLQNALSLQAPSFCSGFNVQLRQSHQSRFHIQIQTAWLDCWDINPPKKVPEILWSLYSVRRLKLRKNWLHSSLIDSGWRGLRWRKIRPGSFVSVLNLHSTVAALTTQALTAVDGLLDS